jgi:hypothetical protein
MQVKQASPKNRVRLYSRLSVRYEALCRIATRKAKPIVAGTHKKSYRLIVAYCQRAKSSAASRLFPAWFGLARP